MERLQKIIARFGKYSRREAEELIREGRVFVNNKKVTEMGLKFGPTDKVVVCGHVIPTGISFQYVLFHKPRKCMVTREDPEGRKTVYDYLPKKYHRLKPVGRLDYDSEGLLLLTNDGALAYQLTHPQFHLEKTYQVKVQSRPGPRQIQRLERGILLDGRKTLPVKVSIVEENPKSTWLEMTMTEGRNRQIRRMCEKVGLTVKTLVRSSMGPFKLAGIPYTKSKEIRI